MLLLEVFVGLFLSFLALILGVGSIYIVLTEGSSLPTDLPISIGFTLLGLLGLAKIIIAY